MNAYLIYLYEVVMKARRDHGFRSTEALRAEERYWAFVYTQFDETEE